MKILKAVFVVSLCFTLSSAQNDIRMPPSITIHPSRKRVIYRNDESIKLDCKGTGVPNVTYEWKKDDFILNQHLPNILRGADGTITIRDATSVDEGFYQCLAKNQYGTAASTVAHIQRTFLESASGTSAVLSKTVQVGMPFHIQADPRKSFPKPIYSWEIATDTVDKNPIPFRLSKRIQISDTGNLHFAYALPEDDLGGRIYKFTTYNPYLDVKAGGGYTKLTVTTNPGRKISESAPTLAFSSEAQTVAFVGGNVTFRCFFYGYPVPSISWKGPGNTLPTGRYAHNSFNTELTINNITESDEGTYHCKGFNARHNTHTLQMRVEAEPKFQSMKDGPYNVNVTEGESVTFNCSAIAKPQAKIVWLQNGQPIDVGNPPKRFVFSNDLKSLTIRDVCRDCVDGERKTDLMVIQCNASNVHGYAFASGYLNVLLRTKVMLTFSSTFVSVDLTKKNRFQFVCSATSDPSTPPTVRWYKVGNQGQESVYNESLYVYVMNGNLTIFTEPNCSSKCDKYLAEYRCVGDNGYSRDTTTVSIGKMDGVTASSSSSVWGPILTVLLIGLVLVTIGVVFGYYRKRGNDAKKRTTVTGDRAIYHSNSVYEEIGYESIDVLREEVIGKERPMFHACSMYEYVGYECLDLISGEARCSAEIVQSTVQSNDVNPYINLAAHSVSPQDCQVYASLHA